MAWIITQRNVIPPAARPVDWHPTVTCLQDSSKCFLIKNSISRQHPDLQTQQQLTVDPALICNTSVHQKHMYAQNIHQKKVLIAKAQLVNAVSFLSPKFVSACLLDSPI